MTRTEVAVERLTFARNYSLRLIDSVPEGDWFWMPTEGVTNVAWQVGHLAVAEYRLCLARCRGVLPDDDALISEDFVKMFGAGSPADLVSAKSPTPSDIRVVLDRVHARVLAEVATYDDADLDGPQLLTPHMLCKTKADCLVWAPAHEMVHAGQIGLLRRLLGHTPLW